MGKVRKVALGDEQYEEEQKRKADARRQTKMAKKSKAEGGERTASVDGTDLKPEFKKLVEEVEQTGETSAKTKAKKEKPVIIHVRSKRYQEVATLVDKNKAYPLTDAIELVKRTSLTKFDGSVELHINLNPLTLGEKKDFRGTVTFPHGTGKQVKVVVADEAIIARVAEGKIEFDVLVAHPSMMPKLAKVAKILGPRGLMPNPKNGTVTPDVDKRVKELSHGQVNFKTEPNNEVTPLIHVAVGKVSFETKKLEENVKAMLEAVGKGKITKATLTATMGPGVKLSLN